MLITQPLITSWVQRQYVQLPSQPWKFIFWLTCCGCYQRVFSCIVQGQTSAEERATLQQQLEAAQLAADEQRQQAEKLQGRVAELEAAVSEARSGADAARQELDAAKKEVNRALAWQEQCEMTTAIQIGSL